MKAAPAALVRAALRARELARQTDTELVIIRDGKLVREPVGPDETPLQPGSGASK